MTDYGQQETNEILRDVRSRLSTLADIGERMLTQKDEARRDTFAIEMLKLIHPPVAVRNMLELDDETDEYNNYGHLPDLKVAYALADAMMKASGE